MIAGVVVAARESSVSNHARISRKGLEKEMHRLEQELTKKFPEQAKVIFDKDLELLMMDG